MKYEIYWNTHRDMLIAENLTSGNIERLDEMPKSFINKVDEMIKQQFPEQHYELCLTVGNKNCEYGRVYQFCACNFSTRDNQPDIDMEGELIVENVPCPVRHKCTHNTCRPRIETLRSDREIDVVKQFVKGVSEEKIAEQLFITESTVHNHITNIYRKLKYTGKDNPHRLLIGFAIRNNINYQ